jgi:hypothetical protein
MSTKYSQTVQWFDDLISALQEIVDRNDPHTIPGNAIAADQIVRLKAIREKFTEKANSEEPTP